MTTSSLIFLIIGIAVGWGIEAILDYFFWHPRRNCDETERQLRTTVHSLERNNASLLGQLEAARLQQTHALNGRETTGLVEVIQSLAMNRGALTVNVNSDSESKGGFGSGNSRSGNGIGNTIETPTETSHRPRADNLSAIWGIGPKTESLLKEKGIETFRQLADSSLATLRNMFEAKTRRGSLLSDEDFLEWQTQANLAAENKIEQLAQRKLAYSQKMKARRTRNLDHIWGIGKMTENELNKLGIHTLRELANVEFEEIETILQKIGGDYGASTTVEQVYEWVIIQAKLAANGYWGRLDGFQERFRGEGHTDDFTQIELIDEEVQAVLSNEYYIRTWQQLAEIDLDAAAALQQTFSSRFVTLSTVELLDQLRSIALEQAKVTTSSNVDLTS
ncbi:helix-hairpin-helix domain-containing protein [Candidatus Leptofilum sp.]|uniref:helix-hairpin-helix domain-containing protein n=1 Tax=Candidatus Leptofilum sp. TaxID=3241576 RepID=UPI003B5A4AAA